MSGDVFQMQRGWGEHDMFLGDVYSRRDAWAWLIENACWKTTRVKIKGQVVELQRGQLSFASRFLAQKWLWSKSKVDRFFDLLRENDMITTGPKSGPKSGPSSGQGANIITICNYDKYQFVPRSDDGEDGPSVEPLPEPSAGHQRAKEEERTIILEPKGSSEPAATSDKIDDGDDAEDVPDKLDVKGAFEEWCAAAKVHDWRIPKGLPDARRKKLASRLEAYGNTGWTEALTKAGASPFLTDPANRKWFDFDWLTKNDQNILKVLEGKYDGASARGADEGRYVPSGQHTEAELAASRAQLIASGELAL